MNDWFKKWFSSDEYLRVYSHRNIEDAENILNLILDHIDIPPDANVLDAACGAGRHSIILAKKGYNVTAFDLSKNLLNIGYENAVSGNVNVDFLCADIREIHFKRSFNLVLNMFTSFGYFETDFENFLFFRNVKSMMQKGSFLVLDYINPSYLKKNLVGESFKELDNKQIVEKRRLDDNFVVKDIEIKYNSVTKVFNETVKLYNYRELKSIFSELGFNIHKVFGNYHGEQFSELNSERIIVIFTL